MKPREAKHKLLTEWLHKADSDLGIAEHLLSDDAPYPSGIAFHCQQAAEKYLKALLVWNDIDFPKTHDIEELLNLIKPLLPELVESLWDVVELTPYGVELRYPGDRADATTEEAQAAVKLARQVRDAISSQLPMK